MNKSLRRFKLFLIIVPAILIILKISYILYFELQGNFHTITPGEAYRSAQLDRKKLEYYIKKYNIKTIISLRYDDLGEDWYKDEMEVCARHRVTRHSIPLSAGRKPSQEDIKFITDSFKGSPLPVLIHCKNGADRTGLVAAMWKVIVDKEPKSLARKQLSLIYFHVPIGEAGSFDRFFEEWQP
jgi:undecaprenyl-diphosphatase